MTSQNDTSLGPFTDLYLAVNRLPGRFGAPGVRDPDNQCSAFDAHGYNGQGECLSDGHYLCVECSELSPEAPRFTSDRAGRGDRLRLFWDHLRSVEHKCQQQSR